MSYFDDASLVMIPSGYKTSKVYSVKPTDGSGDLTFSRSNDTATRVNSAGLIEKVRTNLYTYSQSFADASWLALNATKVSTSATDPNGGNTAANITWTSGSARYFYKDVGNLSLLTVSFWVKSNGGGNKFRLFGNGTNVFSADFTATSTWTRYSLSFNGSVATGIGIAVASDNSAADLLVAFAQLETGDIATSYIATTSAAVSVGPVASVPRLDYLNSSCPRLLLEPQRQNVITFSEQLDNAVWTGSGATVVANQAVSPDGYTNADLLYPATSGNFAGKYQNLAAGTTGVLSCYVKQAGKRFAQLGTDNNATYTCAFDLQLGTVVRTATNYTATITSVGNGWYRITAAYVSSAGASYPFVGVSDNAAGAVTVDGTNGLYVWGFQYETSATYATSYIPTLGAAVTRGADACSKTGISSLIGQTEGTLFADFVWTKVGKTYQSIILGGTTNYNNTVYLLTTESSGAASYQLRIGGTTAIATLNTTFTTGTRYKIALAYKSGSIAFYVNGASVGTSSATYGAVSEALSQFRYDWPYGGDEQWCSPVNQTLLFKTRLTNAQLAELTTI